VVLRLWKSGAAGIATTKLIGWYSDATKNSIRTVLSFEQERERIFVRWLSALEQLLDRHLDRDAALTERFFGRRRTLRPC
jgi:hypothetical protein